MYAAGELPLSRVAAALAVLLSLAARLPLLLLLLPEAAHRRLLHPLLRPLQVWPSRGSHAHAARRRTAHTHGRQQGVAHPLATRAAWQGGMSPAAPAGDCSAAGACPHPAPPAACRGVSAFWMGASLPNDPSNSTLAGSSPQLISNLPNPGSSEPAAAAALPPHLLRVHHLLVRRVGDLGTELGRLQQVQEIERVRVPAQGCGWG